MVGHNQILVEDNVCRQSPIEHAMLRRASFRDSRPVIRAKRRGGQTGGVEQCRARIGLPGVARRNGFRDIL